MNKLTPDSVFAAVARTRKALPGADWNDGTPVVNPNDLVAIVDLKCKLVEARLTEAAERQGSMPADSVIASATYYPFRGWLVVDHVSRHTLDFVHGKANAIRQLRELATEQALRQTAQLRMTTSFAAGRGRHEEPPVCTCGHLRSDHVDGLRCRRGGVAEPCSCQRFELAEVSR